jgi:hypothetical protein
MQALVVRRKLLAEGTKMAHRQAEPRNPRAAKPSTTWGQRERRLGSREAQVRLALTQVGEHRLDRLGALQVDGARPTVLGVVGAQPELVAHLPSCSTSPTSSAASSPARMPVAYCRYRRARSRASVCVPVRHLSTRAISWGESTLACPPPPQGRPSRPVSLSCIVFLLLWKSRDM